MIFLRRRRLFIWLIRAYLKKKGKSLLFFFIIGLALFLFLKFSADFLLAKLAISEQQRIGIVGAYTLDSLPTFILQDVSVGLTTLAPDGTPKPGIAKRWVVSSDGKTYKFDLFNNLYFSDGTNVTSKDINLSYKDVTISRPSAYAMIFHLKDSYSPFLVTLSHPILKNSNIGVGKYRIQNVTLNGDFVQTIKLIASKNSYMTKTYQFYPTQDALKTAYVLGEINKVIGLTDIDYNKTTFSKFPNTEIIKSLDSNNLVTLFYNTSDSKYLSDKRIRDALTYALPNTFPYGSRTYTPYPPQMWFAINDPDFQRLQDFTHSQLLLKAANINGPMTLTITTFPEYVQTAKIIQRNWEKINVKSNIVIVDSIPGNFQVFLYAFNPPKDPDQYSLWHSGQPLNIGNFRDLRIDQLLEDGRKTIDVNARKIIYADFEKYLIDGAPASFLYYPYVYSLTKK